jgi:hypothetical protein
VREQNWFAVVFEIAILVIGVFLGIEASNWNEARQQDAAAREYIARIREDLAVNVSDLEGRSHYYRQVQAHGLRALTAFEQPAETLGASFLRDAYEASQIIPRDINRSTYDEILSVGAVNWISSVDLRKRLAGYYVYAQSVGEVMDYVPPYREHLRTRMPYAVQLAIVTQCPEQIELGASGGRVASLQGDCAPELSPQQTAAAVAAIHHPDLMQDLTRTVSDIDIKLAVYGRVMENAKALDAELDRQGY